VFTPTAVVFVRHHVDCPHAKEPTGPNAGEFFKSCGCRKWIRWSQNGVQHRVSAKTSVWAEAEPLCKKYNEKLTGHLLVQNGDRKTISNAIDLFLSRKRSSGIESEGIKKYRRELDRMQTFFTKIGKLYVDEIDEEQLIIFREGWEAEYPSSQTRQKVQERLRAFLKFCHRLGWLKIMPELDAIIVDEPPTMPLDAKQYEVLLTTALAVFSGEKGKKVHALIQLMAFSGLAIRDAVTLERGEIMKDKYYRVVTSRQKTGTDVSVAIPPAVANEVLTVLNGNPKYVFWNSGTGKEQSLVTNWQHDLRCVFRTAFGQDTDFTPHCLRDTFAVNLLNSGAPMEEVARALGNSIRVCEKHYAKWVKSRQDRLDSFVVASW